jgi:hypothetical protein
MVAATAERNRQGQYLPGVSGNPKGRGPGRTPDAVNSLADEGVTAVLEHDLAVVRDARATAPQRRQSLDRLARLGGRRITSEQRVVVDEAGVQHIVEVIARHVTDPEVLAAIADELEGVVP